MWILTNKMKLVAAALSVVVLGGVLQGCSTIEGCRIEHSTTDTSSSDGSRSKSTTTSGSCGAGGQQTWLGQLTEQVYAFAGVTSDSPKLADLHLDFTGHNALIKNKPGQMKVQLTSRGHVVAEKSLPYQINRNELRLVDPIAATLWSDNYQGLFDQVQYHFTDMQVELGDGPAFFSSQLRFGSKLLATGSSNVISNEPCLDCEQQ